MSDALRHVAYDEQLKLVDASVHDERQTIPTGFAGVDALLRRGGLLPGNLVLLGGRTGTRKSTIMENMIVSMVTANIPVGLVGLDEAPWLYIQKLLSVWYGWSLDYIEEHWDDDEGKRMKQAWKTFARGKLHFYHGRRPAPEELKMALTAAEFTGPAPAVLFVDYLALMSREGSYKYSDNSRIPQLVEDLQIWSTEMGTTLVLLHQLSRNDEFGGQNARNAGHIPVSLSQLMYGGEQQADIVLGTYRPALNPLGNMEHHIAKEVLGDRFDEDVWEHARGEVRKKKNSTYLQLLKNRPGTKTDWEGVELVSHTDALTMEEKVKDAEPTEQHRGERRGSRP